MTDLESKNDLISRIALSECIYSPTRNEVKRWKKSGRADDDLIKVLRTNFYKVRNVTYIFD